MIFITKISLLDKTAQNEMLLHHLIGVFPQFFVSSIKLCVFFDV